VPDRVTHRPQPLAIGAETLRKGGDAAHYCNTSRKRRILFSYRSRVGPLIKPPGIARAPRALSWIAESSQAGDQRIRVGLDQETNFAGENLGMRQDRGRDQGFATRQLLVNLERRIGALDARRYQDRSTLQPASCDALDT